MDTNKMREMREAFERTNARDHRRQPPKGNNYIDPMAQSDWESFQKGWKASRESLVVELPETSKPAAEDDVRWHSVRNQTLAACKRAIEAQGLKVVP
ncbi:hypothetical protein G7009_01520 [Pseudomonas capeferrum]|uniref:hypothetical protein n=1 Tax=Pseudomonas capeferrum TaxID=1495066 RepID=UPI0015E30054|nr:hypothetical protein [Pseudomonas capeferrum]MBA1200482.1 hypothetical protein [Pseudomonas capeferrum]